MKTDSLTDNAWARLKSRFAGSKFRSRFKLGEYEIDYVRSRGLETVQTHAFDFIRQRLAPAAPRNDGKQTPVKGHPVFIAQHATGTCCRSCLKKWHSIKEGTQLNPKQIQYVVSVIMRWLSEQKIPDVKKAEGEEI